MAGRPPIRSHILERMTQEQLQKLTANYKYGQTEGKLNELAIEVGVALKTLVKMRCTYRATGKKNERGAPVDCISEADSIRLAKERKCFRLQKMTGDRFAEAVNMVLRGEADYV